MTHESTWPPYEEEAEQKGNQNKREEKEEQEEVEDGKTAGDWHWQVQLRGVICKENKVVSMHNFANQRENLCCVYLRG